MSEVGILEIPGGSRNSIKNSEGMCVRENT